MQSISRSGPNIRKAVNLFWQPAVENICEYCHRKCSDRRISVKFTWTIWKRSGTSSSPSWTRTLCRPLSTSILISVQCSKLGFMLGKKRWIWVLPHAPWTGPHSESSISIHLRVGSSVARLRGSQLSSSSRCANSEPFRNLKHHRHAPMVKYERQLAVGESYHSTQFNKWFPFCYQINIFIIIITIISCIINPLKLMGRPKGSQRKCPSTAGKIEQRTRFLNYQVDLGSIPKMFAQCIFALIRTILSVIAWVIFQFLFILGNILWMW